MLSACKVRMSVLMLSAIAALIMIGTVNIRVEAQGTTGTILGTVTDSTGGAVPEATVQVTNTGTTATQTVTSDAQGRYRVPDLPVGEYRLSTTKAGFQSVVHTGITLNPGANVVVDFALPVGQVTQSVTVEGNVTQVETTSSAISTVVEPVQMRDLPLNGRNFEELILLAPGVVNNHSPSINSTSTGAFTGRSNFWSVSGTRANGQGELLDGTNIQNYQDRGSGSGILGTSLGVDSIAEFQLLTDTYGAQYGGNGSVVNAVTRSGTNDFHGSVYEFLRNSAMDARNFVDSEKQPYKRNQFGGTFGGPIKKDKMFFFVNYEGLRENLGLSQLVDVPDAYTMAGELPSTVVGKVPANCDVPEGFANPDYPTISYFGCGAGSSNAAKFSIIQPYLSAYSAIAGHFKQTEITNASDGSPTGTSQIIDSAQEPGREDYVVGRYDWTISNNDSLFSRYLLDNGNLTEPFVTTPQYPQFDQTRNQYESIGEKHIFSADIINALNLGYTRTFLYLYSTAQKGDLLDWSGDLFTSIGVPVEDGQLVVTGLNTVGPTTIAPVKISQNKFGPSDDVFWSKGAHSLRFGGSMYRIQTNGLHASTNGAWTFQNLPSFFTDTPSQYNGPCNYGGGLGGMPGCTSGGVPLPPASALHDMRETQFSVYAQDDWKVRPTVTVNLGIRYEPTNNPWDADHQIHLLVPVPFGPNGNLPDATANGTAVPSSYIPENNFMLRNPSLHNFDPRIGVAWDPFKDHKTSVRAGFGIFHAILQARDYSYGAFYSFPWVSATQTSGLTFPNPFQTPISGSTNLLYGMNPFPTTPYLEQWNLSVQREIMKDTVVTVAYVGSHGVHLLEQVDQNPPTPVGGETLPGSGAFCGLAVGKSCGGISVSAGQTLYPNPNFPTEFASLVNISGPAPTYNAVTGTITCASACTLATANGQPITDPSTGQPIYSHIQPTSTAYTVVSNNHLNPYFSYMQSAQSTTYSIYNALQASLIRRMSNNFSLQVSYTYSDCVDLSSGNWGGEGGTDASDPYNLANDRGPCGFMIRHNLTTNGLYMLPFKGNRLVAGWQLGGVFYFSTGSPFTINTFALGSTDISSTDNRPNYVANATGCNNDPVGLRNVNTGPLSQQGFYYVNASCFVAPPLGEVGNVGRNSFFQPDIATFNANLQKTTKISERFSLQFRVEAFNLFNRKNFTFLNQKSIVLTELGTGSPAALAGTGTPSSTYGRFPNVIGYPLNGSARQLQFGLKLLF